MNKPARLQKQDPLTVHLTPKIILAGALIILAMVSLSIGLNDNYYYLLGEISDTPFKC